MTARSEFSGSRLRLARAFKGLTQHELAELAGKAHQYIGYLEAGHKLPTDVLVDAIAQECGFAPTFLFGEGNSSPAFSVVTSLKRRWRM
jgi:transcriptional regulator with XRE-family HTH domain